VNARIHRSSYYSADTIDHEAGRMLQDLAPFREKRAPCMQAGEAALLVLDMQAYFADPSSHAFVPSLHGILPRIERLARIFVAQGRPVVASRHVDADDPSSPMRRWWRGAIEAEDPRAELIASLPDLVSTTIVKTSYDAFLETELESYLRKCGTNQVVICGVHTHLCCETTARSAFTRGFDVFFAIDGTATYNEEFHLASLRSLAHGFAVPVLCCEIEEAMVSDAAS